MAFITDLPCYNSESSSVPGGNYCFFTFRFVVKAATNLNKHLNDFCHFSGITIFASLTFFVVKCVFNHSLLCG